MRAFLSLLESQGGGEILARDLGAVLARDGVATRAALAKEGIVRAAPRATAVPCDGVGCAREVRERPRAPDGTRRFLAVCTEDPRACETVFVTEPELAQEALVPGAFLAAVRRALRIEAPRVARIASKSSGLDEPVLLGEQLKRGVARDVFLAWRPGSGALRALLAERALARRGTLVLVLTADALDPQLAARHGSGRVAIEVLADRLAVRNGRIVEAARVKKLASRGGARRLEAEDEEAREDEALEEGLAAGADGEGVAKSRVLELLPRAIRWNEVTIFAVDPRTVGVVIDKRHRRFGAADFGLAHKQRAVPVQAFELLVTICEQNGDFTTAAFGKAGNGKRLLGVLKVAMCAAFGIAESPFEPYSRRQRRWRPRFQALSAAPGEVRGKKGAG